MCAIDALMPVLHLRLCCACAYDVLYLHGDRACANAWSVLRTWLYACLTRASMMSYRVSAYDALAPVLRMRV